MNDLLTHKYLKREEVRLERGLGVEKASLTSAVDKLLLSAPSSSKGIGADRAMGAPVQSPIQLPGALIDANNDSDTGLPVPPKFSPIVKSPLNLPRGYLAHGNGVETAPPVPPKFGPSNPAAPDLQIVIIRIRQQSTDQPQE